ncbi:unnamed protein product [Moneuplotes crassus]|uniref:Uncharacterized protein n=1 Tax=Euplotes crassus TaxID=5936 RepID=A0AAD1XAQ5_EUPCR|nr:unnamed protein product [Moneuplotes crassus]
MEMDDDEYYYYRWYNRYTGELTDIHECSSYRERSEDSKCLKSQKFIKRNGSVNNWINKEYYDCHYSRSSSKTSFKDIKMILSKSPHERSRQISPEIKETISVNIHNNPERYLCVCSSNCGESDLLVENLSKGSFQSYTSSCKVSECQERIITEISSNVCHPSKERVEILRVEMEPPMKKLNLSPLLEQRDTDSAPESMKSSIVSDSWTEESIDTPKISSRIVEICSTSSDRNHGGIVTMSSRNSKV